MFTGAGPWLDNSAPAGNVGSSVIDESSWHVAVKYLSSDDLDGVSVGMEDIAEVGVRSRVGSWSPVEGVRSSSTKCAQGRGGAFFPLQKRPAEQLRTSASTERWRGAHRLGFRRLSSTDSGFGGRSGRAERACLASRNLAELTTSSGSTPHVRLKRIELRLQPYTIYKLAFQVQFWASHKIASRHVGVWDTVRRAYDIYILIMKHVNPVKDRRWPIRRLAQPFAVRDN
jgi:hypothetical protein